jgi:hypothetical protein
MVKCLFGGQTGLNKGFTLIAAIALTSVFVASIADAGTIQKKKRSSSKSSRGGYSGPETGLLGVKLYDSGLRVISLYGNPDSITTVGGGTTTGAGGQGSPPGGFGGPGAAGAGGGAGGAARGADLNLPGGLVPGGGFGDSTPDMQKGGPPSAAGAGSSAPAPGQGRGGPPSGSGAPGAGGPGGAPGGGGAGGAGGATEAAVFTRWSYARNGCKLAFVIDKFDRVIQIEAIGLQNQRISTRRGIGFGSSFGSVMKAYAPGADPDGYDISGNNFTIRFLTRNRVAFRLTQLSAKKAHVVTGIVVAAGKQ